MREGESKSGGVQRKGIIREGRGEKREKKRVGFGQYPKLYIFHPEEKTLKVNPHKIFASFLQIPVSIPLSL